MEDKLQLLESIFLTGGNYKPKELEVIREKLVQYLEKEDDLQIRLAISFVDAVMEYGKSDDIDVACEKAAPIFEKLLGDVEYSFFEIRLLAGVSNYAESFEDALILTRTALEQLEKFCSEPRYLFVKFALCHNLTERLLRAKYCDRHYTNSSNEIEEYFAEFIDKATMLCVELFIYDCQLISVIRKGLFYKDHRLIEGGLKALKDSGNTEILSMMEQQVKKYSQF